MKDLLTIFKREFAAYFNAPIAYIFIVVFIMVNAGLFMTSFFLARTADMRGFFGLLPLTMIIFVPAITMRLWAEDRKSGTMALLQSFPMPSNQLVLGKFAASFIFLLVSLAGTIVIPIMIASLGSPDWGPIIGGYVGSALLGAFFLAIGLFISGLFRDQITAFIMSMVVCFGFYMIGTDYIAAFTDSWLPGLGSFLKDSLGVAGHFAAIERGVLDIRDILYFLSYCVIFLLLNGYTVEGKLRRYTGNRFTFGVVAMVLVGIMFNAVVGGMSMGRFDLTEGKIYTVSPAAKNILSKLKDVPITVRYYVSPSEKMPTAMKNIERDVSDKMKEFENISDNFKFEVYDPTEEDLEELRRRGITPFDAQSIEQDAFGIKRIFSTMTISYLDKPDEVIPQVVPQTLPNLEYDLMSKIYRMVQPEKPVVAIYAPLSEVDPRLKDPQMRQMMMQMGQRIPERQDFYKTISQLLQQEGYEVRRINLTRDSTIPDNTHTLVVMATEPLSERQRYEISRFLARGGSLLMGVQYYAYSYAPDPRQGMNIIPRANNTNPNELLRHYGLTVSDRILMDREMEVLNIPTRQTIGGIFQTTVPTPVQAPIQIRVSSQDMNNDYSITNRISSLLYLWGTALDIDQAKIDSLGLKKTELLWSSDNSWTIPRKASAMNQIDFDPREHELEPDLPLGVMITGTFPDIYAGEPVPVWPGGTAEEGEELEVAEPVEAAPGKLLLLGCAEIFSDRLLSAYGNGLFFLNSIDALTLGEDLINIRSKFSTIRYIQEVSTGSKIFWRFFTIFLVPIILIAYGIIRFMLRRKQREDYLRALGSTGSYGG
jgi:ABC-2 type transport system permease protein